MHVWMYTHKCMKEKTEALNEQKIKILTSTFVYVEKYWHMYKVHHRREQFGDKVERVTINNVKTLTHNKCISGSFHI